MEPLIRTNMALTSVRVNIFSKLCGCLTRTTLSSQGKVLNADMLADLIKEFWRCIYSLHK